MHVNDKADKDLIEQQINNALDKGWELIEKIFGNVPTPDLELTEIENKLFKDVTKEQLIRSRQHFHDHNTRLSNELFRANNRIKNLSIWIKNEIEILIVLYESEKENHMKEIYMIQRIMLERSLMELENRKNEV